MKVVCENSGLNANFMVVRCDEEEIEATLNKFSMVAYGNKVKFFEPISIGCATRGFGGDRFVILFKCKSVEKREA